MVGGQGGRKLIILFQAAFVFWLSDAEALADKGIQSVRKQWLDGLPSAVLTFITCMMPVYAGMSAERISSQPWSNNPPKHARNPMPYLISPHFLQFLAVVLISVLV
jgi:hypothetical protein